MSDARKGILAMVVTCVIWGLSPLYYKLLSHIPPIEILTHRTIWSAVIFTGLLLFQGRLHLLWSAMKPGRGLVIIAVAATLISINWFVFIWSIANAHATEASLGYFLFPLVAVLFGRVIFAETLSRLQLIAVGMAFCAVVLLTVGLGVAPWIALILSGTFGFYGVIKKQLTLGPVVSVTGEVLVLLPIAAVILFNIHSGGTGRFGPDQLQDSFLLVLSGALTATPLIMFSYATKRAKLSTIGLLQYINPTLQFICAVAIFGEPFGFWHAISFPIIWGALAVYTVAALRQDKAPSSAV
ncbi:EamA family transporter RarD [Shimia thalassica]|uniref:EamA family transporter RarD n=1 Tax=Shimia thalassica TaxID=1715693 RepID=UPI0026E18C48|nr:EamA family transporter RarD [Shimia thalassica]MDO6483588.1 EamA family transporter RarD [Shimia thalassica]MDP2580524.1 EamA family transporter RarD [Shimia thalassica]